MMPGSLQEGFGQQLAVLTTSQMNRGSAEVAEDNAGARKSMLPHVPEKVYLRKN